MATANTNGLIGAAVGLLAIGIIADTTLRVARSPNRRLIKKGYKL